MAEFVKFELSSDLRERQLQLLEKLKKAGKFRAGVNEVTKAVERGTAKLVILAEDTSPVEVVLHLPVLCKEKNIPFGFVANKKELGEKAGL